MRLLCLSGLVSCGLASIAVLAQTPASKDAVPKDKVKELFEGVCSGCHSLDRIKARHFTREQWRNQTRAMIDEGAVLTPEETNLILDYLVKNFGPEPEL